MSESTTIEHVGDRSVHVRITGADKWWCTILLAITADGHKLPLFVFFGRKKFQKTNFYQELLLRVWKRGWVTEEHSLKWMNMVWKQQPDALLCKRAMLVFDSSRSLIMQSMLSQRSKAVFLSWCFNIKTKIDVRLIVQI